MKGEAFPSLFLTMISLGEKTGYLPEVLGALEKYYQVQQNLTRQFWSQITLPVIQFFLAVLIVAFVIWVFGILNTSMSLFGLRGTSGALIFLGVVVVTIFVVCLGYQQLARQLRGKAVVDRFLLSVPGIGSCLQTIALSRFTLAMQMTLDTDMTVQKALASSLQATGNAAYEIHVKRVRKQLQAGEDLTTVLTETGLFPEQFRILLAVAEESGSVPEVMRTQCQYYQEEAQRQLKALAQLSAWGVWLIYAIFAILMIFQICRGVFGSVSGLTWSQSDFLFAAKLGEGVENELCDC